MSVGCFLDCQLRQRKKNPEYQWCCCQWVEKPCKRSQTVSSIPPWSLLQFPPWLPALTSLSDGNKPFSPHLALYCHAYHSNKKWSRAGGNLGCVPAVTLSFMELTCSFSSSYVKKWKCSHLCSCLYALGVVAVASELGHLPHLQEPSLPVRVLSPSAGLSLVTALTLVCGVSLLMGQSPHYKSSKV